jgi:hypothetical protein
MNSSENRAQSFQRDDVDDVLVAFWEWLRLQEARWRDGSDRKEFHFSPSIAAGDPFLDAHRRPVLQCILSATGPSRHFAAAQQTVAFGGIATAAGARPNRPNCFKWIRRGAGRMLAPRNRASCSFCLQGSYKINKVLAYWFLFDREKASHESGALTGPEE